MPFPFIPAAVLALTGAAYLKLNAKRLNPDQERLYQAALVNLRDPAKLRQLAQAFDKEGFREQADMLYKRAHLKDLPKEIIKARNELFHKAMASRNLEIVRKVADAFEQEGATNAAAKLREHILAVESEPKVPETPKPEEVTIIEPPKPEEVTVVPPSEPTTNPDHKTIPAPEPEPKRRDVPEGAETEVTQTHADAS